MCRFLAYKGAPIIMDQLLYQPRNSIIHQSYGAKEIEEPLNGDGFGVGWYVPELNPEPAVFVSVHPAWSNRNLRYISPRIRSGCIFAHVRAASFGDISEANCHPFHFKNFMMMHNGSIEGFDIIKRSIRRQLSDEVYAWVRGQTDSEHFFALWVERMLAYGATYSVTDMADALQDAVDEVEALKREHKIAEGTYLNTVVTDGNSLVATRFITTSEEPLTLYYSAGSRYQVEDRVCRMVNAHPDEHAVLVVSEKLTSVRSDWTKIPGNHMILVDAEDQIELRPMSVAHRRRHGSRKGA